jgi:hypothetical protein
MTIIEQTTSKSIEILLSKKIVRLVRRISQRIITYPIGHVDLFLLHGNNNDPIRQTCSTHLAHSCTHENEQRLIAHINPCHGQYQRVALTPQVYLISKKSSIFIKVLNVDY